MEFICKYCDKVFDNKRSLGQHEWKCKLNPNHKDIWNKGLNKNDYRILKGVENRKKSFKEGKWKIKPFYLSEETRKIISEKRKLWLKNNPDKHPWKRKSKFISTPCEYLKNFFRENNISFIEEYDPKIENHFFSLDIAFPDIKLAIEVNGNQHYDKYGNLLEYYKNRHEIIEKNGWKLLEIHYSKCYNFDLNILTKYQELDSYDKDYTNKYFSKKQEKKLKRKLEKENKEKERENEIQFRKKVLIDLFTNSNIKFDIYGYSIVSIKWLENNYGDKLWFHSNLLRQIRKYTPEYVNLCYKLKSGVQVSG